MTTLVDELEKISAQQEFEMYKLAEEDAAGRIMARGFFDELHKVAGPGGLATIAKPPRPQGFPRGAESTFKPPGMPGRMPRGGSPGLAQGFRAAAPTVPKMQPMGQKANKPMMRMKPMELKANKPMMRMKPMELKANKPMMRMKPMELKANKQKPFKPPGMPGRGPRNVTGTPQLGKSRYR